MHGGRMALLLGKQWGWAVLVPPCCEGLRTSVCWLFNLGALLRLGTIAWVAIWLIQRLVGWERRILPIMNALEDEQPRGASNQTTMSMGRAMRDMFALVVFATYVMFATWCVVHLNMSSTQLAD